MASREGLPALITEAVLAGANRALSRAVQQEEETNALKAGGAWVQKCRTRSSSGLFNLFLILRSKLSGPNYTG